MKTGMTVKELDRIVKEQALLKHDFIVPTMAIGSAAGRVSWFDQDEQYWQFSPNAHFHSQLAEYLSIPAGAPHHFYKRMLEKYPDVYDFMINNITNGSEYAEESRMIRTLGPTARALLSDRYRPLDNDDLLDAIIAGFRDRTDMNVVSCNVTDSYMHLKFATPRLTSRVIPGEVLYGGMHARNSEIGMASLMIAPYIVVGSCSNGATYEKYGKRTVHLGGRAASTDNYAIYRDETMQADDRAFFLKLRDTVEYALSDELFESLCNKMKDATDQLISNPPRAVEVITKRAAFSLSDEERDLVLNSFMNTTDFSMWGLSNAITAASALLPDYDRATELEAMGGALIDNSKEIWEEIVKASTLPQFHVTRDLKFSALGGVKE